jgi:hypothetical protein
MSEDAHRKERLGRNEAVFRALNEGARQVTQELAFEDVIDMPDVLECVCECSDASCTARIHIRESDYELARAESSRFIVATGHELPEIERTIYEGDGFLLVEKRPGPERRVAVETDPRHN